MLKLLIFRIKWRIKNKSNSTIPRRIFNRNVVSVGKYTYGSLNIFTYGSENEGLEIGSYVSIASGVKFILGGNHHLDTISNFPIKNKVLFQSCVESTSKGKIKIEDDVWIGTDSIILSGVTIGQGAVVGAGSVVSKSVPPYAIVVGNPAKVLKYRFSNDIIEELIKIDYKLIDKKFIENNIYYFDKNAKIEDIKKIVDELNKS
ncbi:hypothetical protein A7K91_21320 [Paenibacillus oryzae]|uniref:Acetyltransferase n=2 Tax=Paenibacillus oryzae TaxID=1844972 RepID=A0A1A5YSC4_9BACL|nr:hypothetical protein A7K91_21320 [Paenibacillus oryzae]